jgi:hypothetical protein
MAWRVVNVRSTESSPDRDTVSAALVEIERGSDTRRIVVELAGTADAVGKTLNAREAVKGYLDDDEPPRRLIITTYGVSPVE